MKTMKCRGCGKARFEFESHSEWVEHTRNCKSKKEAAEVRAAIGAETDESAGDIVSELEQPSEDMAYPSIPLRACPPELAYLKAGRQEFLIIAGRVKGDKFYVESTKLMR